MEACQGAISLVVGFACYAAVMVNLLKACANVVEACIIYSAGSENIFVQGY